jgi:hypothetical protein
LFISYSFPPFSKGICIPLSLDFPVKKKLKEDTTFIEYYQKISQRGLSSLISISDEAFNRGIVKVRAWAESKPQDQPMYDPVDIFVFQKRG